MLALRKKQSGLSLVESMISLLVISIGLLGIASLQINAMRLNSSSYWHSQAIMAAHNMADRIRANEVEINNYIGINTFTGTYNQDCQANPCTTSQMLIADATDWVTILSSLPSGGGIIRAPDSDQLNIVVFWDDEGTGASGTACGNNPTVDLACYTITMRIL